MRCQHLCNQWLLTLPSKLLWWHSKELTHSSKTSYWCIITHKFFQMVKWSQDIINRSFWSKMLSQSRSMDSIQLQHIQFNNKCQHVTDQMKLSRMKMSKCKIQRRAVEKDQRPLWRPRKLLRKRPKRLLYWLPKLMELSQPLRLKIHRKPQDQARTSWSSQRKYSCQASHQKSELLAPTGE